MSLLFLEVERVCLRRISIFGQDATLAQERISRLPRRWIDPTKSLFIGIRGVPVVQGRVEDLPLERLLVSLKLRNLLQRDGKSLIPVGQCIGESLARCSHKAADRVGMVARKC